MSSILMDLKTTNAIVTARQEEVARLLSESRRPSKVWSIVGLMLIRAGERLRQDVEVRPARVNVPCDPPTQPGLRSA